MKSTNMLFLMILLLMAAVLFPTAGANAGEHEGETTVARISPEAAYAAMENGDAIMVCSYADEKCETMRIKGALLKSEFVEKTEQLPKTQTIIFYCN